MNWKVLYKTGLLFSCYLLLSSATFAENDSFFIHKKNQLNNKKIAITFDDGPHPAFTEKILNILDFYDVKATFFLIGENIDMWPKTAKKIVKQHHEVGNHSYKHFKYTKMSKRNIEKDIQKSQQAFSTHLGVLPTFFRPPYGRLDKKATKLLKKHFSHAIYWSIDPQDWKEKNSAEKTRKQIESKIKPGMIILCHERKATLKFLPQLITNIKSQGYEFVTISELLKE